MAGTCAATGSCCAPAHMCLHWRMSVHLALAALPMESDLSPFFGPFCAGLRLCLLTCSCGRPLVGCKQRPVQLLRAALTKPAPLITAAPGKAAAAAESATLRPLGAVATLSCAKRRREPQLRVHTPLLPTQQASTWTAPTQLLMESKLRT